MPKYRVVGRVIADIDHNCDCRYCTRQGSRKETIPIDLFVEGTDPADAERNCWGLVASSMPEDTEEWDWLRNWPEIILVPEDQLMRLSGSPELPLEG